MDDFSDVHNVNLFVSQVRDGQVARNPHQTIRAVVNIKLPLEQAKIMRDKLDQQLANYFEGQDVIMLTLEGEFT